MFGSNIDLHLRCIHDDQDPLKSKYGAFLVEGEYKILPNILINNVSLFGILCEDTQKQISIHWSDKVKRIRQKSTKSQHFIWTIENQQLVYNKTARKAYRVFVEHDKKTYTEWNDWKDGIDPDGDYDEYYRLFDEILENYPHIDSLSNKVLLSSPCILEKTLVHIETKPNKSKQVPINNVKSKYKILVNGNITSIFSKQSFSVSQKITDMSIQKKHVNIYVTCEGHKHDKIEWQIATTKRLLPKDNSMNSGPLKFPVDGDGFICPLTCKEMKDAGISLSLADGVIGSPIQEIIKINHKFAENVPTAVDIRIISFPCVETLEQLIKIKKIYPYWFMEPTERYYYNQVHDIFVSQVEIEKFKLIYEHVTNFIRFVSEFTFEHFLALKREFINWGFIGSYIFKPQKSISMVSTVAYGIRTNVFERSKLFPVQLSVPMKLAQNCIIARSEPIYFSFENYLVLKRLAGYCAIYHYNSFIHLVYCESIPLKYIPKYEIFVSPYEYNNLFPNELNLSLASNFCSLYSTLPKYIAHTIPEKISVTMNNIKGSCYNVKNQLEYEIFRESPGYNTAINFHGKYDYTKSAVVCNQSAQDIESAAAFHKLYPIVGTQAVTQPDTLALYVACGHLIPTVEDGKL
jgi:hypothetical protein